MLTSRRPHRNWIGGVIVLATAGVVAAAPQPQQEGSAPKGEARPANRRLDEQLLEGLEPVSKEAPRKVTAPQIPTAAGEDIGARSTAESRLAELSRRMREVEARLRQRDTSPEIRQMQDAIAQDLARLIDQRQQQRQQEKRSQGADRSSASQRSAAQEASQEGSGPGQAVATRRTESNGMDQEVPGLIQSVQSVWGELPSRVRQRMQALGNEEFLPAYADIIRKYYERLSEQVLEQQELPRR